MGRGELPQMPYPRGNHNVPWGKTPLGVEYVRVNHLA